jgi:biotin carboxylase
MPLSAVSMRKILLTIFVRQCRHHHHIQYSGRPQCRVDTHAYAGYKIPPHYDSMIAKLIVSAPTREEAIKRMRRSLEEFVIEGNQNNHSLPPAANG